MSDYGRQPSYGELVAIILLGIGHIVTELYYSAAAAIVYNVVVSVSFVAYLVWRVISTPGVLHAWGFRRDNFVAALKSHLPFVSVSTVALVVFALLTDYGALPKTFWLTVALYPIWGTAQQFALQNLIAKNVSGLLRRPFAVAALAALLFAASHYPRLELVALTFVAGIFFTLAHRRQPNIWAVGTVHGLLGSLAFYVVLGEDPGALILNAIAGAA